MSTTISGPDGKPRCRWCAAAPEFFDYHDTEWGFPVDDDFRLFEKLSLEGFQSGLSWRTILAKRENFRKAFHGFDYNKIAKFTAKDVDHLLRDEGIVRHRGKIEAVINNAQHAVELVKQEGSLAAYIWQFEPNFEQVAVPQTASTSDESVALSKALKKQGWKFVGPTTVYAFMQAMGLINDHVEGCMVRGKVESSRKKFRVPHKKP
ncbi:MAG TPA: DNA-3-methyladenine glycosylase I [Sulfuriferula sp.]|nr:DNA-3-methyladenine glycosylase I [Sulfuriferula sp.]